MHEIKYEDLYLDFIHLRGVGSNDLVASSPASYLSYLRSVARLLGSDITPAILRTELDVTNIAQKLKGQKSPKTVRNYCSAMRQYVAMVKAKGL